MSDIQHYFDAAESLGRGGSGELGALESIVTTLGTILGPQGRQAVAEDGAVADNLEFNLREDQAELDRTDPATWLLAAEQHGEDEDPDHRFGDLQDYARSAWRQLGPEAVAEFEASDIARKLAPAAAPRA